MIPFKNVTNVKKPHTSQGERAKDAVFSVKSIGVNKENQGCKKDESLICPHVSAKSWAIVSGETGALLFGKNHTDRREIASLTKVMTCYTVLNLVKRWDIKFQSAYVDVPRQAALINGTRAEFAYGDRLTVWDLLHGLMLPSGNDAALCLAEHFGQLLFKSSIAYLGKMALIGTKFPCKYFIAEMNVNAKILGLNHTNYANPHGLANTNNKSTAEDLGRLCAAAMKLPKFRQIANCKEYQCECLTYKGQKKMFKWVNTHKLLWEGFNGIKTGITPHAGPCLASNYEKDGVNVIIILLNSKSMEARWSETLALTKWAQRKLKDVA